MATQIFGRDHAVLLSKPADIREDAAFEIQEEEGNVFRGFFYAMLFNLFLLLTGAAAWEVWRLIR